MYKGKKLEYWKCPGCGNLYEDDDKDRDCQIFCPDHPSGGLRPVLQPGPEVVPPILKWHVETGILRSLMGDCQIARGYKDGIPVIEVIINRADYFGINLMAPKTLPSMILTFAQYREILEEAQDALDKYNHVPKESARHDNDSVAHCDSEPADRPDGADGDDRVACVPGAE